jgi:polysaccharide chain length determinant protein (PEP-CTERM system associated)
MISKPIAIQDYWKIIIRRKWYFLIPFVTVSFISVGVAYILPDIYRSTTLIFVEPQKVPEAFVKPTTTVKVEDRLKTITQQIMSRTQLEKVIQEFGLYQTKGHKSRFESVLATIPLVNSYWSFKALDLDTAVERMRNDIEVNVKGEKVFTISYQGADREVTMRVTNKVASLFIEENLKVREQQAEGTTEFLENELNNSRLLLERQEKQIKEFKQRYMGELPQQLEANLRALDRFQLELKSTVEALKAAEDRKESIEKLLATARTEATGGDNTLATRLEQLKAQLSYLQAEYKEDYPDIALIRKEIKEIEETLSNAGESSKRDHEREAEMLPRDPFIQNLANQLRELNLEILSLKARRANLTKQISLFEKRVENTPVREQQLTTIMRDYENIQRNYQSLLDKRLEAKISENLEKRQQGEIFRVLDPANFPLMSYGPNRWLIVFIGILMAAGSGIGFVFLREQVDQSFKTGEELSETLGMPVLATIPHQPPLRRQPLLTTSPTTRKSYKVGQSSGLLVQRIPQALLPYTIGIQDPSSITAEQFRVLHTCLEQAYKTKGWKVFCVTSAVRGEGKTFTALNLAMTMAKDFGKKTVLMDVDCKGTILQTLIGQEDQTLLGWSDMVQKKCGLHEALISFASEKFFLLPTGKVSGPSSSVITLLGSSHLLQKMRSQFDYIVMDAPPVLPLADIRLLEDLVDGMILVVQSEKTSRDLGIKAASTVPRDKILGFVLNGAKLDSKHYYYYKDGDRTGEGKVRVL